MPPAERPVVTGIIPCRNEERYIGACLESLIAGDYPTDRLELLVVDGQSADRTREVVGRYSARHPFIRVVDNPRRTTPCAFNIGIREAKGDVVLTIGAHAVYSRNHVSGLVDALLETGADNVGGQLVTLPANDTATARAVAIALSHPFGVGNSHFRIGIAERRWVDTVPFGCYRKQVFERIGPFDEELVRNQDDELNGRLRKQGGRILIIPEVKSYYFARGSLRQVARMFYQYGYFKPIAAQKIGRVTTVRQLVPALFLVSLVVSGAGAVWLPAARWVAAGIGGVYAALVLWFAARAARTQGLGCAALLAATFPVLHVSYGLGFLTSVARRLLRRGRRGGAGGGEETPPVTAMSLSR